MLCCLITHQTIESREKALRNVSRFPFHSSLRLTIRLVRPPQHAPQRDAARQVEEDDRVCALEHGVTDLPVVVAVDDPAVRRGRERSVDPRLEHVGRRLLPACVVVERVELDVRDAEPRGELAGECRLAGARAADDGDAPHSRNSPRATTTAEPPTSTSSGERATA